MIRIQKKNLEKLFIVLILLIILIPIIRGLNDRKIVISGSCTLEPIVARMTEIYKKNTGQTFSVAGGGSPAGINDVLTEKSDIGMISRKLSLDESKNLKSVTIGYDALAIIVNPKNPINTISKKTLKDLYTRKIKNWKDIENFNQPVDLVYHNIESGASTVFSSYLNLSDPNETDCRNKACITESINIVKTEVDCVRYITSHTGAIGFVSYGSALSLIKMGMPIKILPVDGITPDNKSISSQNYPLTRELNLVYKSDKLVKAFIEFTGTSEAQRIVEKLDFTPISGFLPTN